ncbi:MAG: zinc-ribbon domain containing protein [Chloroflexota bacterium]|nr:zinc-ribbon domain containing protein [Dehalococcoidia bacterium]MDW8254961.1 zinc-ribbon domain containing protein [Chloroflexota bacterium]
MTPLMDKTLTCRDCGSAFLFTVSEQEFYASKGFMHEPTRCRDCRARRRAAIEGNSSSGGTYSSGGVAASSYGMSYAAGSARREFFSATCSSCGNEARVPFQPRPDKPVYCSNCFETQRSSGAPSRGGRATRW